MLLYKVRKQGMMCSYKDSAMYIPSLPPPVPVMKLPSYNMNTLGGEGAQHSSFMFSF